MAGRWRFSPWRAAPAGPSARLKRLPVDSIGRPSRAASGVAPAEV
jgi:hypothetical protein